LTISGKVIDIMTHLYIMLDVTRLLWLIDGNFPYNK